MTTTIANKQASAQPSARGANPPRRQPPAPRTPPLHLSTLLLLCCVDRDGGLCCCCRPRTLCAAPPSPLSLVECTADASSARAEAALPLPRPPQPPPLLRRPPLLPRRCAAAPPLLPAPRPRCCWHSASCCSCPRVRTTAFKLIFNVSFATCPSATSRAAPLGGGGQPMLRGRLAAAGLSLAGQRHGAGLGAQPVLTRCIYERKEHLDQHYDQHQKPTM